MFILLLVFSLFQTYYADPGQGPASIELRAVSACGDQDSRRSIWSIVLSCLSTIFLCTWVAVHPNIAVRPDKPNAGWREQWIWDPLHHFWSYKLPLFIWALLIPEYILSWSLRQFIVAGEIRDKVPGWTRTHGFFMLMGGFHLFRLSASAPSAPLDPTSSEASDFIIPLGYISREEAVPVCPLQIEDIPAKVLEILSPTKAEIKDKGKSDGLTKLIVLVQTLWFVIQCIARRRQHLPLSELEVVTLAYTMLNFFTYVFWWNKPQNVGCPIRVYKTSTAEHRAGGKEVKAWHTGGIIGLSAKICGYFMGKQDDDVEWSQEFSVPMFWSGRPTEDNSLGSTMGMSILATGFGGIHFIAWNSDFPSGAELILWRVACILLTAVPLTPFIFGIVLNALLDSESAFYAAILPFLPLYIAGRAVTLVITFTALRSLPDAVLTDVDWTTFIPHI